METIASKSALKSWLDKLPEDTIVQINGGAAKIRASTVGADSNSHGEVANYEQNVHEKETL